MGYIKPISLHIPEFESIETRQIIGEDTPN
jgi:hypothetical protein